MTTPTVERCCYCHLPLVVWTYVSADGDMMFNPTTDVPLVVVEGDGKLTKRAALVCPRCDSIANFPRTETTP